MCSMTPMANGSQTDHRLFPAKCDPAEISHHIFLMLWRARNLPKINMAKGIYDYSINALTSSRWRQYTCAGSVDAANMRKGELCAVGVHAYVWILEREWESSVSGKQSGHAHKHDVSTQREQTPSGHSVHPPVVWIGRCIPRGCHRRWFWVSANIIA